VPFGAWYLGRYGWMAAVRYGLIGLATIAVLWLPFLAADGPANYLRNLGEYQNDIFAVLSLRAWNPWWIVQSAIGGGEFVGDGNALVGPVTFRVLGLAATALLAVVVFVAVVRRPTTRRLGLGLAAITLVAFTTLTTMHERYAFAALVFLAPLLPDRRVLAVWLVLGVTFTLNLVAAVPPTIELGRLVPIGGLVGLAGSIAMTVVALLVVAMLAEGRDDRVTAGVAPTSVRSDQPIRP
jgi:hypothetical protein